MLERGRMQKDEKNSWIVLTLVIECLGIEAELEE
jgi:hypothetical protein